MKDPWENINEEIEEIKGNKESPDNLLEVIRSIQLYYLNKSEYEDLDPSEDWKRKAGLVQSAIPSEVDSLVRRAFVRALRRFSKF